MGRVMRAVITAIAGLALAAGAYLTGTAVAHGQDARAQHSLMGAVVSGQSVGIDGRTYVARLVGH
jgi:hypothetical protein